MGPKEEHFMYGWVHNILDAPGPLHSVNWDPFDLLPIVPDVLHCSPPAD